MCDLLVDRMKTPYLWPEFIFKFTQCYRDQQECLETLHGFTKNVKFYKSLHAFILLIDLSN